LVVDLLAYPDSIIVDEMEVATICERIIYQSLKSYARIHRYAIPLLRNINDATIGENLISLDYTLASAIRTDGKIILSPQLISESRIEGPEVNPSKRYSRYRFVYASGLLSRLFFANSRCKGNVER